MATETGSIFSDIRVRLDKLSGDLKKVDAKFDQFAKENKKTTEGIVTQNEKSTKKVTKNWLTSFSAIKIAGVAALIAVGVAFKKAVGTFAATEQSLANVQAAANATAADMKRLEDAAASAGETTRFSASQAADALFFLASAGFTAQESIDSLDATLLLAGATGSDLAESANVLTATLSQFNLEAEDSERVVNIFAAANSNSQATLQKMAGALRQVGPIAGTMGIALEEVTGSLQLLFNAGFRGEAAGTALRNTLGDLGNAASPVIERLGALGIAFEDVNPNVVGLTGAIRAMEEGEIKATQAIEIFGKESGPQLASLLSKGSAAIEEYEKAVTDTDEAARQYAVQNDTLAGSFDSFKSKLEGFGNSFIQNIVKPLRGLLDIAGNVLTFFTNVNKAVTASRELAESLDNVETLTVLLEEDTLALAEQFFNLSEQESLSNTEKLEQEKIATRLKELYPGLTQEILASKDATLALVNQERELNKLALGEEIELLTLQQERLNKEIAEQAKILKRDLVQSWNLNDRSIINTKEDIDKFNESQAEFTKRVEEATTTQELNALALEAGAGNIEQLSLVYGFLNEDLDETTTAIDKASFQLAELDGNVQGAATTWETYTTKVTETKAAQDEENAAIEETITLTEDEQKAIEEAADAAIEAAKDQALQEKKQQSNRLRRGEELRERRISLFRKQQELVAEQGKLEEAEALRQKGLQSDVLERGEELRERKIALFRLDQELAEEQKKLDQDQALLEKERQSDRLRRGEEERKRKIELFKKQEELLAEEEKLEEEKTATLLEQNKIQAASERDLVDSFVNGFGEITEAAASRARIQGELEEEITKKQQEELDKREEAQDDFWDHLIVTGLKIAQELFNINGTRIQNEIDAENELLETQLTNLDAQLLAELAAAGLSELTTIQKLEKKLAAAIAEGEAETAAELEQQIARLKIIEDFDEKKAAVEKESARKIAQLQYEADLNAWNAQGLQIISSTALGAVNAASAAAAAGPIAAAAAAAIMLALGVAQGINHVKGKPTPPAFQTGGLVLGGGGSSGTNVNVAENGTDEILFNSGQSGERFIRQFADGIAQALASRNVPIHATFIMNDQVLFDAVSFGNENGHIKGVSGQ